jgi:hypothetical protein
MRRKAVDANIDNIAHRKLQELLRKIEPLVFVIRYNARTYMNRNKP